jgi:type IV pilus assembly protein PilN
MIKINLVAETPAAAATKKRRRPEFSLGAKQGDVILLITIAVAAAVVGTRWFILDTTRDNLKAEEAQKRRERDELKPFIDKVEELERKRETLKHKIEVINDLKNNQQGPVRIMDEVSRALPELVWLTGMDLQGTVLVINGMAMDENAIANYIANLNASPFVTEEVALKNIRRAAGDVFQFALTAVFTYSPAEIAANVENQAEAAAAGGDV